MRCSRCRDENSVLSGARGNHRLTTRRRCATAPFPAAMPITEAIAVGSVLEATTARPVPIVCFKGCQMNTVYRNIRRPEAKVVAKLSAFGVATVHEAQESHGTAGPRA